MEFRLFSSGVGEIGTPDLRVMNPEVNTNLILKCTKLYVPFIEWEDSQKL